MGRRPDESEAATCASHGSYGPHKRPNHLKSTWALRTALRITTRNQPLANAYIWLQYVKASRPLIRVLVINDNHCGLTFLFQL
jgi:hypothetical protein